jgi:hypothetical protein
MFLEGFLPSLFLPNNRVRSARATVLLRAVAKQVGDQTVMEWMERNYAYEFTGLTAGWLNPPSSGHIWIGLNVSLLHRLPEGSTTSAQLLEFCTVKTAFAACHELGHLSELLQCQRRGAAFEEGRTFTLNLLRQELAASAFGHDCLRKKSGSILEHRYKLRAYHYVMAAEAAYPGLLHLAVPACFFCGTYGLMKFLLSNTPEPLSGSVHQLNADNQRDVAEFA